MIKVIKLVRPFLTWFSAGLLLSLLVLLSLSASTSLAALPVDQGQAPVSGQNDSSQASPAQQAAAGEDLWRDVNEALLRDQGGERLIIPKVYRVVAADIAALDQVLAQAPLESSSLAGSSQVVLALPLPDGAFGHFRIEEAPIMEAALAARYPEIKTYRGWGLDDPTAYPLDFLPQPPPRVDLEWPADSLGFSLEQAVNGVWVEGEALQLAWEVVNAHWVGMFVQEGEKYYQLSVQVPGVSMVEPPAQ